MTDTIKLTGRFRSTGAARNGTLLTFSVRVVEPITDEIKQLMSERVDIRIAKANGHHPTQTALPLPVVETEKPAPQVIVIPGQPMGKPRMTQRDRFLVGDKARPCVKRYRWFCDVAREAAREKIPEEIEEAHFKFFIQMPDSWDEKTRLRLDGTRHFQKPDIDNLIKAVLDALLENDEIVACIGHAEKIWVNHNPRVEVIFS